MVYRRLPEPGLRVDDSQCYPGRAGREFSEPTKRSLGERVAYMCSNPLCRRLTIRPQSESFGVEPRRLRPWRRLHYLRRQPDGRSGAPANRYQCACGSAGKAISSGHRLARLGCFAAQIGLLSPEKALPKGGAVVIAG